MTTSTEGEISRRHPIRTVASFAAAFIVTAAVIHFSLPDPLRLYANIRSEKLLLLQQWQGRVSSAVFGASHANDGLDPRTFDSALAGTPLRTTTLNLGIEGGSQSEQRAMALTFVSSLRPHPDQACFVLLELNAGANLTVDHLVHPRTIDIYDWKTVRFIHGLSTAAIGRKRGAGRFAYALAAAAMYYSNVGMLSNLVFTPPTDSQLMLHETEDDRRGLMNRQVPPGNAATLRRLFAQSPRTMIPRPEPLLPGNYALVDEIMKASPVKDLHVLYWVSPQTADMQSFPVYPAEITVDGVTTPILSMARPDLYPDLYQPQNWYDYAHLSASGAPLLGKHLATQLSDWYRTRPQQMSCGD
jgi:hypothetical protein